MGMVVRVFSRRLFLSMIVRVFGQRLFHEHESASIWSETLMSMKVRVFKIEISPEMLTSCVGTIPLQEKS